MQRIVTSAKRGVSSVSLAFPRRSTLGRTTATWRPVTSTATGRVEAIAAGSFGMLANRSFPIVSKRWQSTASHPKSTGSAGSERDPGVTVSRGRGEERTPLKLEVGDRLHGFRVFQKESIPERNLTAYRLIHEATGAEHLHLDSSDTNNVFSVTYKTAPKDSTGVAHILEHTVLCGSKKYPVRDPFFNMLKRSLNTYMNAWTAADYTMYPFSTQNEKDFKNLLSVYLDATLFPKLEETDFMQEGHRLEFEVLSDPQSPLAIKGVVFNEMKGAMSDAASVFHQRLQSELFPTTTYHHNSGGEPLDIPKLTYEGLKSFHRTHYHPSNARFYTYGDLPLEEHLKTIAEEGLNHFIPIKPDTEVGDEIRYEKEQTVTGTCPPLPGADPERQTTTSIAYLLNPVTKLQDTHTLSLISSLLLSGPNAPFYKALIEADLGLDFAPGTGYNANTRETFFSVGLVGVRKDELSKVWETINKTLEEVVSDDSPVLQADNPRIQSFLHQIELNSKQVTSKTGLTLGSAIQTGWIHGADPVQLLKINDYVEQLKYDLAQNPRFLKDTVSRLILQNPHKVRVTLEADSNYSVEQATKEKEMLQEIAGDLNETKVNKILKDAELLKQRQEEVQDLSLLPTVSISDVSKDIQKVPFERDSIESTAVYRFPQPTNTIVYFNAVSPVQLPEELSPYLPLFCVALTSMGAGGRNTKELSLELEAHTGGISASPFCSFNAIFKNKYEEGVAFSARCLDRKVEKTFDLLRDIVTSPDFTDKDRLRALISQSAQSLQESLTYSGHHFAQLHAGMQLSRPQNRAEAWGGISQLLTIQDLMSKGDLDFAIAKLQEIASIVLKAPFRCSLVAEKQTLDPATTVLNRFLNEIDVKSRNTSSSLSREGFHWRTDPPAPASALRRYVVIPAGVNFIAKVAPGTHYIDADFSRLQILAQILSTCYLHKEVREKGGAYGGGASARENSTSFYSYRDPQLSRTLAAFEDSVHWALRSGFTDQDIEEAKLSVFADLDSPLAPSQKGTALFKYGITDDRRQQRRDHLFQATRQDLLRVAEKYLLPAISSSSVVVLGGQPPEVQESAAAAPWEVSDILGLGSNGEGGGEQEQ